jgi:hypothetical protein
MAKKLYATLRLFHAMYPYTNYVIADRAGARLSGLADAVEQATRIEMDALKQMDFEACQFKPNPRRPAIEEIYNAANQPDVVSSSLPRGAQV